MPRAERTKQALAKALQGLATKKPIARIQVKEICAACEIERSTFYYHFHDKYELVAWIFSQLYALEAERFPTVNSEEMMAAMFSHLWEQREFFLNALQDNSQNNLREYLVEFYVSVETAAVQGYLGCDKLDERTSYELRHYSYGCMGHTVDWLLGRLTLSGDRLARYQYELMPPVLKEAFSGR